MQGRLASGVLCGVGACMLWGFVYLVPLVLPNYSPAMIAAGRFVCFGLAVAPFAWAARREMGHYTAADWIRAAELGVIGNIFYYWLLSGCIQNAGAPLAGMCMAVIPVLASIVANWRDRRKGRSVPWVRLAPSLLLIAAGLVIANITEFEYIVSQSESSPAKFWYGTLLGIGALLVWTWYPISNADWLQEHPERSASAWSTAQGITMLPCAAVMYIVFWLADMPGEPLLGPEPAVFLLAALASGFICSWCGIWLWNAMSQRLPTALGSQMIVFETIFAVLYAHALRLQWPSATMTAGMVLLVAGVLAALRVFR